MRKLLLLLFLLSPYLLTQTAPTRVSNTETASWGTTGASKSAASTVSYQTNDVVVIGALSEDGATLAITSAAGLTFTSQKDSGNNSAGSTFAKAQVWAAVAASTSSGTITLSNSTGASKDWGFTVWVYRGSDGIGNSVEQHTTRTVNLTPTAAHSAVIWVVGDFSAGAAVAGTPTPTTTVENTFVSGRYTANAFDLTDQTSSGATAYGLSSGAAGPYSIIALEIKGAAGGATTPSRMTLVGVGP